MILLLSPAKRMRREEVLLPRSEPVFLSDAECIRKALLALTPKERSAVWKCSAKLAAENEERLKQTDLRSGVSPALFSYCGLAYSRLAPEILTDTELDFLQEHLRILSGLYGVLKPMDGIVPYRLEMEAPFSFDGYRNLYEFWGDRLARHLEGEDSVLVNLASREYADAVCPHLSPSARCVEIVFAVESGGKLKTKATHAKMARGAMVQWIARHQITKPEEIRNYDEGYRFSLEHSEENRYVFLENGSSKAN